jgi:hypothetical protein
MIKRADSIENILYDDALQRKENLQAKRSKNSFNTSFERESGQKSDHYLIQGFKKEYDYALKYVKSLSGSDDYVTVMAKLGFVNDSDERGIG